MLSLHSLGMQKIPHNLKFKLAKIALTVVQFGESYTIFHIIVRQEKHRDLDVFDVIYLRRPHYSALDFVVSSFLTHSPGMEKILIT